MVLRLVLKYFLNSSIGKGLPIFGIGLGVFLCTVVLGIMAGFVQRIHERILGAEPHIEIYFPGKMIPQNSSFKEDLKTLLKDDAIQVISIFQKDAVLKRNERIASASLIAWSEFTPYLEERLKSINQEHEDKLGVPKGYLGQGLMGILGAHTGEEILLIAPNIEMDAFGYHFHRIPLEIEGKIMAGATAIDSKWLLVPMDFAQDFFEAPQSLTSIYIFLKDPFRVQKSMDKLDSYLKETGLNAKTWMESQKSLLRALALERFGMTVTLFLVIIMGCLSVMVTLLLAVKRKTKEMAILISLGLTQLKIAYVYLIFGGVMGITGSLIGSILGVITLEVLRNHVIVGLGTTLPSIIDNITILSIVMGSITFSFLAAILPALYVFKSDPIASLSRGT